VALAKLTASRTTLAKRRALARRDRQSEHHTVLDPVAEERAPVGAEEVLLVAAELEVRERVAP
jgi:hypothetical protein